MFPQYQKSYLHKIPLDVFFFFNLLHTVIQGSRLPDVQVPTLKHLAPRATVTQEERADGSFRMLPHGPPKSSCTSVPTDLPPLLWMHSPDLKAREGRKCSGACGIISQCYWINGIEFMSLGKRQDRDIQPCNPTSMCPLLQ